MFNELFPILRTRDLERVAKVLDPDGNFVIIGAKAATEPTT